ncbi:MAG TPA: hypothetical protein VFC44_17435 [Candidatus Saccharimonadales bacterium]|nr:hypothetical protein [Candidatus Saccharimonadales bacterium]
MKAKGKILYCLAVVLSEFLCGCSRNYQAEETERAENNREIIRLATLINPTNPPVTGQMLETGEFDGNLQIPGFEFVCFHNTSLQNAQPILVRLLKYSLPPERRKSPSGFGESAEIAEDDVRERAAEVLITTASPAVIPVLREWLKQGLAAAEAGKQCRWGEVAEAAMGLGQFHDVSVVPPLVKAWQDRVFNKKMDAKFLGDMAARRLSQNVLLTLDEMPSPVARNILLEAMNDRHLDESMRYPVAAALVRLDDQSAREFLLDGLDRYLATDQDTSESSRHVFAKYELEKLGDAKLISAIQGKTTAAVRRRPKLVMTALVERMRLNNLPMAELKRIAAEDTDLDRRLPAISILGNIGNSDLLPFLESLTLVTDENLGESQKNLLADVVKAAIRNLHLHNWQQPEKKS